ncbi:MAG: DUF3772 domain-containing protein [Hyphomicrobiaceae bacterium]
MIVQRLAFILRAGAVLAALMLLLQPSAASPPDAVHSGWQSAQVTLPNWAAGLAGQTPEAPANSTAPATAPAKAAPAGTTEPATAPSTPTSGAGPGPAQPAQAQPEPPIPPATSAPAPAQPAQAPALDAEQTASIDEVVQPVKRLVSVLDDLEKTVERVKERDDDLSRTRSDIDKIPPAARKAVEAIEPRLADVRAQIGKLGPAPAGDAQPEAAQVAGERQRLNALATQLDGTIKSAQLTAERARQLVQRVQDLRQGIFTQQLLKRTQHSPLSPGLWLAVAKEMPQATNEIATIARGWWVSAKDRWPEVAALLALAFVVYFGFRHLRRRLMTARLTRDSAQPPTFFQRAAAASWIAPAIAIPAAAALIVLYVGLVSNGLLYLQTERLAQIMLFASLIFVVVKGLARGILQPARPDWRLVDVSDRTALKMSRFAQAVAAVYAIDLVMKDVIKMLYLPFQVSVAQAFIFSMLFAGLMFSLARLRLEPRIAPADAPQVSRWWPAWLKVPLALVALITATSSLLGYVALGRYISAQVVLTGTALVVIVLGYLAIRAIAGDGSRPGNGLGGRLLEGRLDEQQRRQMDSVLFVALNIVLAFFAVPLLLFVWGFSSAEIASLISSTLFGFDIGGIHISPARILLAIALFVGLIFGTRLVQRWMSATVLQPSRIDAGLANSIHTGVGYAGYAIAVIAALAYGGLDITNIAIVAGALSVGIGFGLQSIVNNFVSGLILLVERPIKVGDWIAVGAFEGHVRRISVRSTEIETFDRSSVIVPNSELISGTVKNRTHRNALGRVDVAVGVDYASDPAVVHALLEKVANESPMVLKFPAPLVSFDNFGASSLDFTVRAYVGDVNKSVSTATDLRMRIFAALKQAGIEIPFPQTDVHLRDLDFVKAVVTRIAAERAGRQADASAKTVEDRGETS